MSEPKKTSEYLLIIRGTHWEGDMSADEVQDFMGKFTAWFDQMNERGVLLSSRPLAHEGKLLSGKGGQSVADGPFAESKEAIGGFFLLQLENFEQAMAIAQASPVLEYGGAVEVRPVIERCSTMQRAGEMLANTLE